jgi:hypothetical protein
MAYGFGSGVRPELGATDYSNYLRGALTGAQMQAQGGAAIGAGVQNALAGIGEGIQKYQQNKILQSEIMGGVEENINFLVNNNPESIQNAPKAVQDILRRMEDAKGVSLKDSAYLNSWLNSATKQAKDNIENNALVSAISPNPDGTYPPGQQMVTTYYGSGGRNQSLIAALLAVGKDPLEVEALKARTEGQGFSNVLDQQQIEGTVPLTPYQKEQLEIQKDNARREEERLRLDQNQAAASAEAAKNAERRAEESIRFASAANNRAEQQAAASAEAAIEKSRVDKLANEGISIFNKGEDEFNKFLETLSPQDQGIVLTEVKQFRDKTPTESKLTAGAISDIMMKRDGNKGPTFGEYLSKLRQASNKGVKKTDDKYVVKGLWNDIDKIPAFEELIRQFPQFKVLPDEGQERRELPNGGFIVVKSPQ